MQGGTREVVFFSRRALRFEPCSPKKRDFVRQQRATGILTRHVFVTTEISRSGDRRSHGVYLVGILFGAAGPLVWLFTLAIVWCALCRFERKLSPRSNTRSLNRDERDHLKPRNPDSAASARTPLPQTRFARALDPGRYRSTEIVILRPNSPCFNCARAVRTLIALIFSRY